MTNNLFKILLRRHKERDNSKLWVFWHTYWDCKTGEKISDPYKDRKKIMKTLCRKAGVKYFRFHALRHSGATVLDQNNVPLGSIQQILGHENRATTEIYLHSLTNSERDAMDVFERVRNGDNTKSHSKSHSTHKKETC